MIRSDDKIGAALIPYGITATPDLCASVQRYTSLLLRWNRRISLTTITDRVELVKFHFGESIFAASSVPIRKGRLADVGSGAGFPGLALRLAVPNLQVTLIESNAKKAAFLSEVSRELRLDHVEVARVRMADFAAGGKQFDFITARALGQHSDLLAWARENLALQGKLVMWLGEDGCTTISTQSGWRWREPTHIPVSRSRFLLVGSPDV